MSLKLNHIFFPQADKQLYRKHELLELKIRSHIIKKMARLLNVTYQEKVTEEGDLCFINNNEVRAEYKTIFTSLDIKHSVFAMLNNDIVDIKKDEVYLPKNPTKFWKLVEKGKKLK